MQQLKNSIKKIIPGFLWSALRSSVFFIFSIVERIGPYMRKRNYCGMTLWYNKGNVLVKRLKNEIIFEKDLCESLVAEIKKNKDGCLVDIGANIGLVSLYVASQIPEIKINAFEPGLRQRELFSKTIEYNNLNNITLYAVALGDSIQKVAFYAHDARNAALDGLRDTKRRGNTVASEVSMITLDSWWVKEQKPRISVIKIDTEGAELLVLRGSLNLINEMKPIIFLEIEPSNLKAYPYDESDIKDFFKQIGYQLEPLTKDTYKAQPLLN